jgi:DNA repair protein RadC
VRCNERGPCPTIALQGGWGRLEALAQILLPGPLMSRRSSLIEKARQVGFEQLPDNELLAILISTERDESDCRAIGSVLLDDFGGWTGLWRLARDGLSGAAPLGPARAAKLAAAFEIGLRCLEGQAPARPSIQCSADIVRIMGPRLRALCNEQIWVLAIDASSRLICRRRVAEGGQHGCAIQARDVLRVVVTLGASAFVLVHNHPGGDPSPSRQDLELTQKLAAASVCVGVQLIDHVIIAGQAHGSLLDSGLMGLPTADPDSEVDAVCRSVTPQVSRTPHGRVRRAWRDTQRDPPPQTG